MAVSHLLLGRLYSLSDLLLNPADEAASIRREKFRSTARGKAAGRICARVRDGAVFVAGICTERGAR